MAYGRYSDPNFYLTDEFDSQPRRAREVISLNFFIIVLSVILLTDENKQWTTFRLGQLSSSCISLVVQVGTLSIHFL